MQLTPQEEFEGKPKFFNHESFLTSIKELCYSDEPLKALKMFELLPSYYQESPPKGFLDLKKEILSKIILPTDYARHDLEIFETAKDYEKTMSDARSDQLKMERFFDDMGDMIKDTFCYPRGPALLKIVQFLNAKNVIPHIVELGPATYWLPHGLKKKNCKFKYKPITLHRISESSHRNHLKDIFEDDLTKSTFHIFVCFEVIEHMHNDQDLFIEYYKQKIDADVVMISTPLNTYMGGNNDKKEFQHLRCYNKKQFSEFVTAGFPAMYWNHILAPSQVLVGSKDPQVLNLDLCKAIE